MFRWQIPPGPGSTVGRTYIVLYFVGSNRTGIKPSRARGEVAGGERVEHYTSQSKIINKHSNKSKRPFFKFE